MRINGVALNGSSRRRVALSGAAVLALDPALQASRVVRLSGASGVVSLSGGFDAAAIRMAAGDALVSVQGAMGNTSVLRGASGDAVMRIGASLYYVKEVRADGEAVLSISARADVGVIFADGQAVIAPLEVALDAARSRQGGGFAVADVAGELFASAIRRPPPSGITLIESMSIELDPSHVDGGGVRHVGMFGDAPVSVVAQDAGMLRQSLVGSLDMSVMAGAGTLVVKRQSLAGQAVRTVTLESSFRAQRRGDGSAVTSVVAQFSGEVYVRGDGQAPIAVMASGAARVWRKGLAGDVVSSIALGGDWARKRVSGGSIVVEIGASLDGVRRRLFSGPMVIQALDFGSAVTNAFAEDIDEQQFVRPASAREFSRPSNQRDFVR